MAEQTADPPQWLPQLFLLFMFPTFPIFPILKFQKTALILPIIGTLANLIILLIFHVLVTGWSDVRMTEQIID
jgi:hypothetical protein